MPKITRTLADFQTFAAKHNVLLVQININKLIYKLAKRDRLLTIDEVVADVVWAKLASSVMTEFRRELIPLMILSLFCFKNTKLAFMFIFCICKYSFVTIRKIIKLIWENKYKS